MTEPDLTYDVHIYKIEARQGTRRTSYRLRWHVGGKAFSATFHTGKLAESERASLLQAASRGEAFDRLTGQPHSKSVVQRPKRRWVDLCQEFIDARWDDFSPRHRKSTVEGLVTLCSALVDTDESPPSVLRAALTQWAFNTSTRARIKQPPDGYADALDWLAKHSMTLEQATSPDGVRLGLRAIGRTLSGERAAASTIARKRAALSGALSFAVESKYLPHNPLRDIRGKRDTSYEVVDPRIVPNPTQVRRLLREVKGIEPAVHAYFAALYFAALRPAEGRNLRASDLQLPDEGWGGARLRGGYQEPGSAWTDDGMRGEERELKHRPSKAFRDVPLHPELVASFNDHLKEFGTGVGGRLFVTRTGRGGHPIAAPFQNPVSMSTVYRVWDRARQGALTTDQYRSDLARRPYDLRHAGVSTWLQAGVAPQQVAKWAGHSTAVLLRVYASCIEGSEAAALERIERELGPADEKPGQE